MRLGWEVNHQPCDHGRRKNDAPNHYATLPAAYTLTPAAYTFIKNYIFTLTGQCTVCSALLWGHPFFRTFRIFRICRKILSVLKKYYHEG